LPHFFKILSSRIFAIFLFAGYSLAIIILILLPLAPTFKFIFSGMLACALFYYLWRFAWLLSPSSVVALRMDGVDMFLIFLNGREMQVQILTDTLVIPFITILSMVSSATGSKHNVVIFPDSLDSERYRELRVLVKWGDFASPGK
jgi:toxin CptA